MKKDGLAEEEEWTSEFCAELDEKKLEVLLIREVAVGMEATVFKVLLLTIESLLWATMRRLIAVVSML